MIIKSLHLKNFGQHSDLFLDIKGPVVGIVGRNGSGKSTIVSALQYAFTGETTNNIQTYIKKGETSAEVEVIFEKNGKTGVIKRGINTRTTTRSLTYGDLIQKPITKAKEFDAMMDQILGVDKQNILSAIFIAQGEIANILSPRLSERLGLFAKLLNLNFLSKRSYVVDQTLNKLRASVTDVGSLKNNLEVKIENLKSKNEAWESAVQEANAKYVSATFVKDIWESASNYIHAQNEHARWETKYQEALATLVEQKNKLTSVAVYAGVDESTLIPSITTQIESLESQFNEISAFLKNQQLIIDAWNNLLSAREENKIFNQLKTTVFYNISPEVVEKTVREFDEYQNNTTKFEDCCIKSEKWKNKLSELEQAINKASSEIQKAEDAIPLLKHQRNNLCSVVAQLETLAKTKQNLKDKVNKDTASCPVCGLKLVLGQEVCDGDIESIKQNIQTLQTSQIQPLEMQLEKATSQKVNNGAILRVSEQEYKQIKADYDECQKLMSELRSKIDAYKNDLPQITQSINTIKDKLPEYKVLWDKNQRNTLQDMIDQVTKTLQSFGLDENNVDVAKLKEIVSTKEQELSKLRSEISNKKDLLSKATTITGSISAQEQEISKTQETILQLNQNLKNHKLKQIRDTLEQDIKNAYILETFNHFVTIPEVQTIASAAVDIYNQLNAEKQVIDNLQQQIDNDKNLINKLEAENAKVYGEVEELARIKQLLQPQDGVIKNYINYLFKSISGYISEYLAYMNANFIIQIEDRATEEDLSFKFQRVDKPNDKYWYPMYQLSGGQKIKLSIAFQLAIQKIICPDLGFLVLDEPTTHLDEESIKALSELLENVGNMLTGQNGQVWIIDHNHIIDKAFTTAINLD